MPDLNKTTLAKPADQRDNDWYVIDATDQRVGRLAARIASVLRGKHKANFTPSVECGDHVVVLNAAKVVFSGAKAQQKIYRRHSLYPGGFREISFREMLKLHPDRILKAAVHGMLPKTKLGTKMETFLRIYPGTDHPHHAQQLIPAKFDGIKVGV